MSIRKDTIRILLICIPIFLGGCRGEEQVDSRSDPGESSSRVGEQTSGRHNAEAELLSLAFRAASKMPANPHEKNRSRAQCDIVEALLKIDEFALAQQLSDEISNWRSGLAHALVALSCAKNGRDTRARENIEIAARAIALLKGNELTQEWRVERIQKTINLARMELGESESETTMKPALAFHNDKQRQDFLEGIQQVFKTEDFAAVEDALGQAIAAFRANYSDEKAKNELADLVRVGYPRLPAAIRVKVLSQLVDVCISQGDTQFGQKIADGIGKLIAQGRWRPRDEVAHLAKLASLRFRLGQGDEAGSLLTAAEKLYSQKRPLIVSIFRGQALRPLAECYVTMGQTQRALDCYEKALDEAVLNPNSRPRLMDLVALCISMATNRCEPNAPLRSKIKLLAAGLGNPW